MMGDDIAKLVGLTNWRFFHVGWRKSGDQIPDGIRRKLNTIQPGGEATCKGKKQSR